MKRTILSLILCVAAGTIVATACKKSDPPASPVSPSAPAPTDTFTGTATSTPTNTRTNTRTPTRTWTPYCVVGTSPTCTPTVGVWCPNSGTVGQYSYNAGMNMTDTYTYVTRIYVGDSVSLTQLQIRSTTSSSITQLVGLYTDNGSGTAPASRITSMSVTMNSGAGWYTANIADYGASAGYYWLATSSHNGTNPASAGVCSGCGPGGGRIDGNMPSSASNFIASSIPCLMANWSCP